MKTKKQKTTKSGIADSKDSKTEILQRKNKITEIKNSMGRFNGIH